ncbi:PREDICTED: uncharacterized protein LOC105557055 [Vollenhovia emeryi]|uniref:uncharacterized protein LOC105557055 n=1 Tax=Vollenhovia emeryi TaxID=411798 RepID=UPI0005F46A1F|nr:PREDICTED: uncharacterized protein LOC105557055 [Vollenhovia emeryi]
MLKLLQANLNRSRPVQDMFLHGLAEGGCALGIATEPNRVPRHPCWAGSDDGSVAITWRRVGESQVPASRIDGGEGWVAVEWGPLIIVGLYLRPSLSRAEAEDRLHELEAWIQGHIPAPLLVAGDFNAKSALWGSRRPDAKGGDVVEWASRLGLHLLNTGTTSTCVRPQGESIIDLTWSSPAASGWVTSWRVAEELELLSDHLPIEVELQRAPNERTSSGRPLKWAVRKIDHDRLTASLVAANWARGPEALGIEEEAAWLRRTMTEACDSHASSHPDAQRARRRAGSSGAYLEELKEIYRERRAELRAAVKKSKERAWEEMILSLDEDPWGRPYKLVMNRLSSGAPPTVEALNPPFLGEVVSTLFPRNDYAGEQEQEEEWEEHQELPEALEVSESELAAAAKKLKAGKAPGPDGIPGSGLHLDTVQVDTVQMDTVQIDTEYCTRFIWTQKFWTQKSFTP